MELMIFAGALAALAIVALGFALRYLFTRGWFLKWIKGSIGFLVLFISFVLVVFAVDLFTYYKADQGEVIATLKFNQLDQQEYEVEFVTPDNKRQVYKLVGDQWQLDVRLLGLAWGQSLPSYKFERLSGRYLTLEQEQNALRTVYSLADRTQVDTWDWLMQMPWLGFIEAQYGTAAFMPMTDSAIYEVRLHRKGLLAEPVNDSAKKAISRWQ